MLKSYKSSIYLVLLCVTLQSWALPQGSNYEPGRKPIPMHGRDDSNLRYSPTVPSTGTVPTGSGYIAPSSFPATSQAYSPTNITLSSHSAPTASFPTPSFPTPSSSNHSQPLPVNHGFLRGVNIGGWLVLEKWMNGDVFAGAASEAKDQFSFDSTPGAADSLERHWSTWFTESDVQTLQSYGINALRIPIGFWSYDNVGTPYLKGADPYLEKAINWAQSAGVKVWIDLHGAPGSQNGFDNSGQAGSVHWQEGSNIARTLSVLKTIATKYGALQYADTVVGIELVNEPRLQDGLTLDTVKNFARDGYHVVKAAAANHNLMIIMHDAFSGPQEWTSLATELGPRGGVGIDTHLYQVFTDPDKALAQPGHIAKICSNSPSLRAANALAPTYVGEWSGATNICVFPDGSTKPGTSCDVTGCQCQSDPIEQWGPAMVDQARRYVEAQMDVFEQSTSGYFFWSWGGPGPWGFKAGVENGIIPNLVTERRFENLCR